VNRKEDGVGAFFLHHAEELGINLDTNIEDIMQYFNLTIIASVEPDMPWSREKIPPVVIQILLFFLRSSSMGSRLDCKFP
jgi:hypothetical protein